ncbi:hypothetical protein F4802DRAFT_426735 [Xylaria palmicola]|nr:hypothetical protein F4802DRAFT_426735 [Xylaria palmicola]
MEDDWSEVSDATIRKRIQNRLAQRKHRQKAQSQAHAQAKKSTDKAPDVSVHPPLGTSGSSLFLPSILQSEPRAPSDGVSGDIWPADFIHNASMHGSQDGGVGTTWSLLSSENRSSGGILDSNWVENVQRGLGKAQPSHGSYTSGIMTEEGAGHTVNQQQHTSGHSIPTDLDTIIPRMTMYSETNQWLPDSPYSNSIPSVPKAPRHLTEQDMMHEREISPDQREHCDRCNRGCPRSSRGKELATNPYGGSSSSNSSQGGGRPPISALAGPLSPPSTSPTLSRMMRDHDIELDQLISQASRSRRASTGTTPTAGGRRGSTHARHRKRRFSDINSATASSSGSRHHDQAPAQQQLTPLPDVPEQTQYDFLEEHELIQGHDGEDDPGPKVTKVVVIYMQERQQ